mmetsp:Transcript_22393/g.21527  ORF Transcript_22393/g.21527 Transcript_22393/m.21527 type:complete len:80 (-) Transcript_22393:133-372(-)
MTEIEGSEEITGSWIPTLVLLSLLFLRWLVRGEGNTPVRLRRWYNMKRIHYKKKWGLRDEKKYKMGAGDGANQKFNRQG